MTPDTVLLQRINTCALSLCRMQNFASQAGRFLNGSLVTQSCSRPCLSFTVGELCRVAALRSFLGSSQTARNCHQITTKIFSVKWF